MEFLHGAPGIVRDPQQQGDDHPVRNERGTALCEERRGQTRQRDEARDAADDDEDLQGDRERQTRGQKSAEAVTQLLSGADSALEDEELGIEYFFD